MSKFSRRVDDPLWKAILEHVFADFLCFFFSDAEEIFDLDRGFEYLDKEFETLFPPEPNSRGVRFVDKLVKVFLKSGDIQFVLVHIEVQSSKGEGDLARRMFEYFYKISDRYRVPVTAVAILADSSRTYRPSVYVQEFMGTRLRYSFNSYKVLDQDEAALRADPNPFAVVVLTALQAIVHRKASDEGLMSIKHDLYDEMMKRKMGKRSRQGLYDFLTYYVSFQNDENLVIFDKEIKEKLGRSDTMGTREYLLEKAKSTGLQKGLEKGRLEERARAEAEKFDIAREMKRDGLSVEQISRFTKLSIEEIEKL